MDALRAQRGVTANSPPASPTAAMHPRTPEPARHQGTRRGAGAGLTRRRLTACGSTGSSSPTRGTCWCPLCSRPGPLCTRAAGPACSSWAWASAPAAPAATGTVAAAVCGYQRGGTRGGVFGVTVSPATRPQRPSTRCVPPPRHRLPKRETNAPRAPRAHRALVFGLLFYALLADFQCGRNTVASGVHIQQRRPPLHPPHHCNGGCSCPHPLPGGGVELKETSSARPTTEEGAPHGCPNLRSIRFDTFRVSNHGVLIPVRCPIGCPIL